MAIVGWRLALRLVAVGVLVAVSVSGCGNRGEESDSAVSGPHAGATLAVVGIQYDATLPLHSAPGSDQPVVASLGPLEDHVVATGKAREVDSSRWFEVTAAGVTGWADSTSLAYLGATDDVTRRIVDKLGGPPTAESILELGRIVATAESPAENPKSRATVTVAPTTVGNVSEVTYDVLGFPDDSIAGERLHVFGTPGDRFTLKKVEATSLCRRGVSGDGPRLCV
jgi:hypothetical protein